MAIQLINPHPFKERILLFGGAGVGKSEAVLNIARHTTGDMWVYDNDYSFAYNRALSTTYDDVDETGRVHVYEADDTTWESCLNTITDMVSHADPATDWLVIDSITPTWGWVQSWFQEKVHGEDVTAHLIKLRAEYADDDKAYGRAVLEDMNWPLVKKEYARLYRIIQQWKGNLIITAEAKAVGSREKEEDRMLYGHLGFKPSGEGSLHHMASTNLLLSHKSRGEWIINTVKDRNREELESEPVENFAMDYLRNVAGWTINRKKEQ
jgi:hypothetical protein